jgi:hypothetical protein
MSGTSLVILAMYSTVNVVSPASAMTPEEIPYLLALLMAAAALTCIASFAHYAPPSRSSAKGASLHKIRRFSGPRERRA